MKMPYPMLISVIVGVTNIIPFFGPFIGAVPCALLILMVNPMNNKAEDTDDGRIQNFSADKSAKGGIDQTEVFHNYISLSGIPESVQKLLPDCIRSDRSLFDRS